MVFLSGEQIGGFRFFAKLEEEFLSIDDRGNVSLVTRILETETRGLRPPDDRCVSTANRSFNAMLGELRCKGQRAQQAS